MEHGLYDLRMGPFTDRDQILCMTCQLNVEYCPGQFLDSFHLKIRKWLASWQPLYDSRRHFYGDFGQVAGIPDARTPGWHPGSHFMILAATFMVSRSHFGQVADSPAARLPDFLHP